MIRAGWNIPSIEAAGGIAMVMSSAPFHIDRLGLLYTRTYNELKGITDAMDQQLSRVLAQGIADGDGPRLIARKMVGVITGRGEELGLRDSLGRWIPAKRRAEILARTEIIRAHHVATIQEYRNWGVVGVHVKAEWATAGDDRVCSECASLEGKIFTLDEIEPMLPLHPQCRCISLPWLEK
jgi:SPP1 gp7 family putative phage head morphogenesis protein